MNMLDRARTGQYDWRLLRRASLYVSIGLFALVACSKDSSNGAVDAAGVDAPLGLDEAGFALKQTQVEELVKACMKRAGFDYVPVDPNATKAAITGTSGLTDDEFRRQSIRVALDPGVDAECVGFEQTAVLDTQGVDESFRGFTQAQLQRLFV